MGSLNKPNTSEVAIENVEKESPTSPRLEGCPNMSSEEETVPLDHWPVIMQH